LHGATSLVTDTGPAIANSEDRRNLNSIFWMMATAGVGLLDNP